MGLCRVVFVGIMLAVIVGIHVIGGTTAGTTFSSRTPGSFFGGRGGGGGGQNTQVLAAVAGALNLSTISLAADLQAGQTVPQIAAAQNVSMTTVDAAYLGAAEQEFNSFAASGRITQAQVSQLYSQQEQDVQNGQFPLLQILEQPRPPRRRDVKAPFPTFHSFTLRSNAFMFTGTLLRGIRNVLRSPLRLVLVVAILGTSLMFVAVMFVLNGSAQQRLAAARGQIGSGIEVRTAGAFGLFGGGGGGALTASQVKTILITPGVASVSEVLQEQYSGTAIKGTISAPSSGGSGGFGGSRFNDNGTIAPSIYGLVPGQSAYTLSNGSVAKMSTGRNLTSTESKDHVALMSSALATANGLKIGSTFTLENTSISLPASSPPAPASATIRSSCPWRRCNPSITPAASPWSPSTLPATPG